MLRRFGAFYAALVSTGVALATLSTDQLALILGGGAVLALLGALATSRTVQVRLHIARSPAVKLRAVHDELNAIIAAVEGLAFPHLRRPPITRAECEPRIRRFEAPFWKLIEDVAYSQAATIRTDQSYTLDQIDSMNFKSEPGWAKTTLELLAQRREALEALSKELPN